MTVWSGSPVLDRMLDGGLPENRTVLVTGGPGTGKSTLAMQFLQAGLDDGERCLLVSTEQTIEELRDAFSAFPFDVDHENLAVTTLHATPGETLEGDDPELTLQTLDGGTMLGENYSAPYEARYITQYLADFAPADRVVLDSVSGLSAIDDDRDVFRRTILDLMRLFTEEFGATALFTAEETGPPTDGDVRTVATQDAVQYNTHGVIRLWREAVGGEFHRFLEIVKMRGVDHDTRSFEVHFDRNEGIRIAPRNRTNPGGFTPEAYLSTGVPGLDELLGGGIVLGGTALLEHDGHANPHAFLMTLVERAFEEGMAVTLVPPVELPPKRFESVVDDRIGEMDDLLADDRLFLVDFPNIWENTRRNVFKPTEHADHDTRSVLETIDERRGDAPMFTVLNVEAQLPMLSEDELKQVRFWEEENLFRPKDTSLYFFNPRAMSDELAAFYTNGAWQVLETWVADSGLQYLSLRKSPDGYLGSTRLVEYVDERPHLRIQQPPTAGGSR